MMLFQNFNIEIVAQNSGGFTNQFHQQVDPQRHIGAEKHRNNRGGRFDFLDLFIGQACRGDNRGNPMFLRIGQNSGQRRGVREINEYVRLGVAVGRIGVNRIASMAFRVDIKTGYNRTVAAALHAGGNDSAHFAVAAA